MDEGASVKSDEFVSGVIEGWGVPDPRESRAHKAVFSALLDLGEPELARRSLEWDMTTKDLPTPATGFLETQRRLVGMV